jgi:hypothetical protein
MMDAMDRGWLRFARLRACDAQVGSEALGVVDVVAGPNEFNLEMAGHATDKVWETLSDVLALDDSRQAAVNHQAIGSDCR